MDTLGDLLPEKQASLLTEKVRNMTKEDIERESANHEKSDLSYHDLASLRSLAVARINGGMTIFTYSDHSFDKKSGKEQDPSTCSCFIF